MSVSNAVADDRARIGEVIKRYAAALDSRDLEELSRCFAESGEFVVSGEARLDGSSDTGRARTYGPGWEEIAPLVESTASFFKIGTHFLGQSLIEVEGDTGTAETYGLSFAVPHESTNLVFRGVRYLDDFRRCDDGWRIQRRTLTLDWSAEAVLTSSQRFEDRVSGSVPC